jgi:DNA recombination protein RmuC
MLFSSSHCLLALSEQALPAKVETPVSRNHGRKSMNPVAIVALILGLLLVGLVAWMLVQKAQEQTKSAALETQMNELRRDLLTLSTTQAQSTTKMETIAGTVATQLESVSAAVQSVSAAVQKGVKDSAEVTSQITSQAQAAMSNELKNTREQIGQIQNQLGQVQEAGQSMHETATKLENILGGAKNRGTFGETTLERLLEDSLPPSQYALQYSFRSGKTADAVVHLRDKKLMAIDSKFPLDAFQRLEVEDEAGRKEARTDFVNAVKKHADSIADKYIVPDEGTLEVALMFVPSEAVYYELLRSTDSRKIALDAYCRSRKIVAVSPNTLFAHLSVIAMGLRGMQIEENAKRLSANLDGLRKHVENFSKPFKTLGTHLKNAGASYDESEKRLYTATNTLENLLNSGEVRQLELEDEQGALTLPPPTAAKKSA